MRKPSSTDALTFLVAAAGAIAAVGFALSSTALGRASLGVGVVLLAFLVRSIGRDQRARHGEALAAIAEGRTRVEQLDEGAQELAAKADMILRAHRKSVRTAIAQGDRIEQRADAMTRRILADLSAATLDAADRQGVAAD